MYPGPFFQLFPLSILLREKTEPELCEQGLWRWHADWRVPSEAHSEAGLLSRQPNDQELRLLQIHKKSNVKRVKPN